MSMYKFTFTLNSVDYVLEDDPINFNETKIKAERDESLKGLFVSYVADLKFVGDGYEYLVQKEASEGICGVIHVHIQYKIYSETNAWSTLFEGVIYLKDIVIDRQKRIVTTSIEDANLTRLIRERKGFGVYTDANKSVNGGAITTPTSKTVKLFNPDNWNADYGTGGGGNYQGGVKAYNVYDLFRHSIDYMTDGQLDFESDFFSGLGSQLEQWDLEMTVLPSIGQTLTINLEGEFGSYSGSHIVNAFDADPGTHGKVSVMGNAFTEIMEDFSKTPNYSNYDGCAPIFATEIDLNTIRIYSLYPIDSITLDQPSTSAVKVADLIHNMGELAITHGMMVSFSKLNVDSPDIEFEYTFEDLFNYMNSFFDLSMNFSLVGGIPTLRIEPSSYFFSSGSPSEVIQNVTNITTSTTLKYSKSGITIKSNAKTIINELGDSISNPISYSWYTYGADRTLSAATSDACGESSLELYSEYLHSAKDYANFWLNQTDISLYDKIFIIDYFEEGGNYYAKQYPFTRGYFTTTNVFLRAYFGYNLFLSSFKRISYNLFSVGRSVTVAGTEISSDFSINFDKIYEFEVPLAVLDWVNILNNLTDKLTVIGQGFTATFLWIDSIEVQPWRNVCKFRLLGE